MDYQAWKDRVRSFSEGLLKLPGKIDVTIEIAPPLSENALEPIAEKWPSGIPDALQRLWIEGSSRFNCHYVWTPPSNELPLLKHIFDNQNYIYGGVCFEPADEIYPGNSGVDPNDDLMGAVVGDEGLALWCNCAIFLQIRNGDCLALDPSRCPADPAVVYLVHDEAESGYISNSLTDFLTAWTKLSFIGPEHWLLDYWLDADSGSIDPAKHKTLELSKLLSPRPYTARAAKSTEPE